MTVVTRPIRMTSMRAWMRLLLVADLLLLAAILRFTGLNWDETRWIHPDEGHMRAVLGSIHVPDDLSVYFDTRTSPLNPLNNGQVYSYGTLPLFLARFAAEWLDRGCTAPPGSLARWLGRLLVSGTLDSCTAGTFTFGYSAVVGRALSAIADVGTVLLIYLIGRRLYGETAGILAMALGTVTAFLIQQAHFFTVDSMACFLSTLAAYLAVRGALARRPAWVDFSLAGLAVGFAAACKVSAALAAGLVALGGLTWVLQHASRDPRQVVRHLLSIAAPLLLSALLALVAFRIGQPYAFEGPGFFGISRSPEWFARLKQILEEQSGALDYPSGRQWTNRLPVIFPWLNMVIWGMGLPLGLAASVGWARAGREALRGAWQHLVPWVWVSLLFAYQSTQWVKAMRYFLGLYPLLIVMAAFALVGDRDTRRANARKPVRPWLRQGLTALVLVSTALWGLAVFSIYLRSHTRLAASRWVFENVPEGTTIANEHWDWGIPLPLDGYAPYPDRFTGIEIEGYNEDTAEKREQLLSWLDEADILITASNRLYASIPRLPERYPLTIEYYRALFAGELGFELVADFSSYPALGPLQFPDQETPFDLMAPSYRYQTAPLRLVLPPAEEAFSVYDHPRVLIFRKTASYSHEAAAEKLAAVDLGSVQAWQTPQEATPKWVLLAHNPALAVSLLALIVLFIPRAIWRIHDESKPCTDPNEPAAGS